MHNEEDTTPRLQPGTFAYAGARKDARKALLAPAIKRVGKGRGEAPLLAKAAMLIDSLIALYDADPDLAVTPMVEESETYFGSIVTRLHAIADERETK